MAEFPLNNVSVSLLILSQHKTSITCKWGGWESHRLFTTECDGEGQSLWMLQCNGAGKSRELCIPLSLKAWWVATITGKESGDLCVVLLPTGHSQATELCRGNFRRPTLTLLSQNHSWLNPKGKLVGGTHWSRPQRSASRTQDRMGKGKDWIWKDKFQIPGISPRCVGSHLLLFQHFWG